MRNIIIRKEPGEYRDSRDNSRDPEFQMLKRIDQGKVTDSEINKVVKSGGEVLKFMEKRANKLQKDKEQLDRKYGKGAFTGIDNDNQPFKDIDLGGVADTSYDPTVKVDPNL